MGRKRLVRFEYVNSAGEAKGVAFKTEKQMLTDEEWETAMWLGNYLAVPDPYPVNSRAFFTREGLKYHKIMVWLWLKKCGFKIKVIRLWYTKSQVLYEDEDQVIIKNNGSLPTVAPLQ